MKQRFHHDQPFPGQPHTKLFEGFGMVDLVT